MQVEALFVHDANGRLLRINEPDPTNPAPRFFLARTAAGNLWRTRCDLPPDLTAELNRLAADETVVPDLTQPPHHEAEYIELLRQHNSPVTTVAGPAYALPELELPAHAMTITPENIMLLETHFPWLLTTLPDYAPVVAAIVDGVAVAVCFSSRLTAQVAEAGVYTEASYRGRGFAADTVRGWAAGVRASGRLPLYSTSWTNAASQRVAKKLGAVQYGVDYSLT
jgi:hypothetical protein